MRIKVVGFTGTSSGMTEAQERTVERILRRVLPEWVVHGDCVGADTDFHRLCERLRAEIDGRFKIRIRPCDHPKRAWNEGFDEIKPVKKPLVRNLDIVADSSDEGLVIGTPPTDQEIRRSGTWHTLRRARKVTVPMVVVWPDGSVSWENFEGESSG